MKTNQKTHYIKILLYVLCILLGGVLSAYSISRIAWLFEAMLIIVGISFGFNLRIFYRKTVLVGLVVFLLMLSLIYNVKYLYPYLKVADSTQNMINTQISIPQSPYHKDLWIYPIVNHKKVNLYYAGEWCWKYFDAFSESTESVAIDNIDTEIVLTDLIKTEYFTKVGFTVFAGVSPLFSEEVVDELTSREPYLYLAMDGLADAEEVVILTDEEYGVYIMPVETFKNIAGGVIK
jgi:hypothetical protein